MKTLRRRSPGVEMGHAKVASDRLRRLTPSICVALLGVLPLVATTAIAQSQTADYEILFEATWTALTHPNDFPPDAHFSRLVGGTHDGNVVFWDPGGIASLGIERMAESGVTTVLVGEIDAEILAGFADQSFTAPNGIFSPGSIALEITVDRAHPRLTLVSMLAPSPDWFVGVHGLSLVAGQWWIPEIVVDLLAYDAGTDDGVTFTSPNQDTDPPEPISLQEFPLEPGVPVGRFTIRRLPEPGLTRALLIATGLLVFLSHRDRTRRLRRRASGSVRGARTQPNDAARAAVLLPPSTGSRIPVTTSASRLAR
jgi:hypothetical protein